MRHLLLAFATLTCAAQTPVELPNGLKATLIEQHESPLLRVEVRLPITAQDLPGSASAPRPGLPELLLRTWWAGSAGKRSAEAFSATLDQNGLRLSSSVDAKGLRLSILARLRDQELAFALLEDLLLRPGFEPRVFESERQRLFQDTARRGREELLLARGLAQNGPHTPPTQDSLTSFTYDDLDALRRRVFDPARVRMVVSGDLTPSQARQLFLLAFGTWTSHAQAVRPDQPQSQAASALLLSLNPQRAAVLFPPPPARFRPILEVLLRESMPALLGHGEEGAPWFIEASAEASNAAQELLLRQCKGAYDRILSLQDLRRAQTAAQFAQRLQPLDPSHRLAAFLDPAPPLAGLNESDLPDLQQAWKALLQVKP